MIVVMAFELLPNSATALLAALAMVAGGCVRLDAIYRIISGKTVVLIAGMLPLATAMTKTGATVLMAKGLVAALGSLGPVAMLAFVFLVTALVGLFISNSATAVLIAPVAIEAAQTLRVSRAGVCYDRGDRLLCRLRDARIGEGFRRHGLVCVTGLDPHRDASMLA
jgi:di/tricarboxylate transporter